MSKPNILPSPVVENPVAAAMAALQSGKDIDTAVYGAPAAGESTNETPESPESPESTDSVESTDSLSSAALSENLTTDAPVATGDLEEIFISDESGRKKITVDWKDREKLKKYITMAAGMRKFQVERDKAVSELAAISPKHKDLTESWEQVESAFSSGGIKGLINLLSGSPEAYDKHLQHEIQKASIRQSATPYELERMDLEDKLSIERKEREKLTRHVEDTLKKSQQNEESASMMSLEALVHPAFDKHRFAGKLGDEVAEARLDKAIWDQALRQLEEYPEGVTITQGLVDKEFRDISNSFRKVINRQVQAKTTAAIANKKVVAQESAAARATSAFSPKASPATEKFKQDIRGGNLVSALTDFMTGKIKL